MKNIKTMNKIIAGAVVATTILSSGSSVFAKASITPSDAYPPSTVSAEGKGEKGKVKMHFMSSEAFKTELDTLVKAGTITQAQEDKILSLVKEKQEKRASEMAKLKNMTEAERKSYFEQNRGKNKTGLFKEIVDQKIVNETQATAIKEAVKKAKGLDGGSFHGMKKGFMPYKAMKEQLDTMVKNKKLTQAQEDKVLDYMNKKKEARKAEKEKILSMTDEQRKAYFEKRKAEGRPDLFKELVDQKLLTEDQSKILKEAMPMPPKGEKFKEVKPEKAQ